jgi:Protein of unknown function, DUF488
MSRDLLDARGITDRGDKGGRGQLAGAGRTRVRGNYDAPKDESLKHHRRRKSAQEVAAPAAVMRRIDALHLELPFYGSRRMTFELNKEGRGVADLEFVFHDDFRAGWRASDPQAIQTELLASTMRLKPGLKQCVLTKFCGDVVAIDRARHVIGADTNTFFTIGHSTRTIAEFVDLLRESRVDFVIDVRSMPRSRTNPQFNGDSLPRNAGALANRL